MRLLSAAFIAYAIYEVAYTRGYVKATDDVANGVMRGLRRAMMS